MKVEDIAKVCHEANRAYCSTLGDYSQPIWEDAPDWQKDSAVLGVQLHVNNPSAGVEASHESWFAQKVADGWVHGEIKDPDKKTHPCMVPFEQLPKEQQVKDHLFRAVVRACMALCMVLMVVGCMTPYKQPDGTFLVTKHAEIRSPFGTNGGYDFVEHCKGPDKKVLFYFEADFTDCQQLTAVELEMMAVNHKQSQGQGGQIVEGAMNAGALGALAATRSTTNVAAGAAAVAVQSTSVTVPRGHRH